MTGERQSVATVVGQLAVHLRQVVVPSNLLGSRREKDFQSWLAQEIREWLAAEHPSGGLSVTVEPSEGGVRPIRAFGTTFWPDVTLAAPDEETVLAIEVKCLTRKERPDQVATSLGQALLYRVLYDHCFVLMVDLDGLQVGPPSSLLDKLSDDSVEFIVISLPDGGSSV